MSIRTKVFITGVIGLVTGHFIVGVPFWLAFVFGLVYGGMIEYLFWGEDK